MTIGTGIAIAAPWLFACAVALSRQTGGLALIAAGTLALYVTSRIVGWW